MCFIYIYHIQSSHLSHQPSGELASRYGYLSHNIHTYDNPIGRSSDCTGEESTQRAYHQYNDCRRSHWPRYIRVIRVIGIYTYTPIHIYTHTRALFLSLTHTHTHSICCRYINNRSNHPNNPICR